MPLAQLDVQALTRRAPPALVRSLPADLRAGRYGPASARIQGGDPRARRVAAAGVTVVLASVAALALLLGQEDDLPLLLLVSTAVAGVGLSVYALVGLSARAGLRGVARVVSAASTLGAEARPRVDRDDLPPPLRRNGPVHGEKVLRWVAPEGTTEVGEQHWRGDGISGRALYLAAHPHEARWLEAARERATRVAGADATVHGDWLVVLLRHRGMTDARRVGELLAVADVALGVAPPPA